VFTNFDVPNGDSSCVKRTRSNTPLQALTSLNETIFVDCARSLALRALRDGGKTDAERIVFAFRICTSRLPTPEEQKVLATLLAEQRTRLAKAEVNASELATGDKEAKTKLPSGVQAEDAAAFTVISRVLLNLDETITRE
jgi:hypothetical protein